MNSMNEQIVVMTAGGDNPQIVINALHPHFPQLTVIQEQPQSKGDILRRRARRLGWIEASGQLATMVVSRLTKKWSQRRAGEIIDQYRVSTRQDPAIPVLHVPSLNSPECHAAVTRLKPKAILTVSCRILSRTTLGLMPCPIVNLHAGINPAYRGQMGGYWSLVENDAANFGAAVHLVDAGTDTGATLYEVRPTPSSRDTMATYPLLLTAAATGIVIQSMRDAVSDNLSPRMPEGRSVLRFNPAIWTWILNGVTKGVW